MSNRNWIAAFILMAWTGIGSAQDATAPEKVGTIEGITEYRLSNGLQILLLPDPSEAKVTVNMTILVGSRHEGYGETGMAHLLEHMLFKDTKETSSIFKALSDHGADFNGTTSLDRTNYYETMNATDENLEFGIALEADRLVNCLIRREALLTEMTVVRNEFEMNENSAETILSQRMNAVAYEWHNYGKSTIGNRSDIERVPVENLQAFYRKYYQPDNAVLIVAGKFDEKKVLGLIEKTFGKIKKPTRKLSKTYTEEPAQDGERIAVLRRVGKVGAVGAIYHVPAGAHPDFPIVDLLQDILSRESGRLHKALVEPKLATGLSGSSNALHDPGTIELIAKCEPANVDKVRDIMVSVLEGVAKEPITAAELEVAQQRYTKYTDQLTSKTSTFALVLSEFAAAGDYRLFFLYRDRFQKATLDQINEVAKKYLVRSNRTVGLYYPTEKPERAAIPETPNIAAALKDYKGRTAVAQGEAFEATPDNIEKRVKRGKLENLQTALLAKKTKGEVADLKLNLRFGNEDSLKGYKKAAEILDALLMRGTQTKNRQQIQEEIDKLGSNLTISSSPGSLSISIHGKKANLLPTLALLEEILRKPGFDAKEFELAKLEMQQQLERGLTDPQSLAANLLRRKLSPYGKDNVRYVPTLEEELADLKALTVEKVKDLYAKQVSAQVGELAVVGDFEPAPTLAAVQKIAAGWTSTVPYKRIDHPVTTENKGGREVIETPDKENAIYLAGVTFPLTDSDPAYAPLKMGNYLFGESASSRLMTRVRVEKGLSYGAGSMLRADAQDKAGSLSFYAIANPANIGKVNATIAEEIAKFIKDGASLDELDKGRAGLLETMKLGRTDDGALAGELARDLHLGRTFEYQKALEKKIQDVKPEEIQKAFREYLKPERITIIEAGDFKKK